MKVYEPFLILTSVVWSAYAGSFEGDLSALGVHAVFPGDQAYSNVSQACKYYSLLRYIWAKSIRSVNERYTFQPAAVTFPSSPSEVSRIVKAGVAHNRRVVARSGGVRDCQGNAFCSGLHLV